MFMRSLSQPRFERPPWQVPGPVRRPGHIPAHGKLRPVEDMRKEPKHFSSNTLAAAKNTEQEAAGEYDSPQREVTVHSNFAFVYSFIPSFICW